MKDLEDIYVLCIANGFNNIMTKIELKSFGTPKAFQFLLQCLHATSVSGANQSRLVKLLIPLQSGYIVRSDIIPLRLRDSEYFEQAVSFAKPLQSLCSTPIPHYDHSTLQDLFDAAVAGLLLYKFSKFDKEVEFESISLLAESELNDRLSFPWLLPGKPPQKTLIVVNANSSNPEQDLGFYIAARELGIKIVVLDNEGHWLEKEEHAHWRECFIPTPLTNPPETDVGYHILNSVKTYGKPIDGIITFADSFWVHVAEIAPLLGLKTAPLHALSTATNKYLTSKFVGHMAFNAFSLEDALSIANKN